jgi:hypothetical protein
MARSRARKTPPQSIAPRSQAPPPAKLRGHINKSRSGPRVSRTWRFLPRSKVRADPVECHNRERSQDGPTFDRLLPHDLAPPRVIYPYGVFASQGFWYCACHDHKRGKKVSLRADRFRSIEPAEGFERPAPVPLDDWSSDDEGTKKLRLRAYVTERGAKSFELTSLFGRIEPGQGRCGIIDTEIPHTSIDFYAARLLSVGTDVKVKSPPELIGAMRERARAIVKLYPQDVSPEADATMKG